MKVKPIINTKVILLDGEIDIILQALMVYLVEVRKKYGNHKIGEHRNIGSSRYIFSYTS